MCSGSHRVRREWWRWSQPQQLGLLCETCTLRSLTPNPRWRKTWKGTAPQTAPLQRDGTRKRFFLLSSLLLSTSPVLCVFNNSIYSYIDPYQSNQLHFSCHVARTKVPASPAASPSPLTAPDTVWWEHLSWAAASVSERLSDRANARRWRPFQLLHAPTLAHHSWRSPQTTLLQARSQTPW